MTRADEPHRESFAVHCFTAELETLPVSVCSVRRAQALLVAFSQ